jgi:hypothetical protein
MKLRPITKKLLIVGLVTSIVGYVGLLSQFCIENCSTSIITPISLALLIIGAPLFVFSVLFAIYQTGLSKKLFWGGLITICVLGGSISLAIKHKNTVKNQKVIACFSNLKPSDDPLKCNKIK